MNTMSWLFAGLALLAASPVWAARADPWFALNFGPSLPVGEFRKSAGPGLEGGASAGIMGDDHIGFGVDVAYHRWGRSEVAPPFIPRGEPNWVIEMNAIVATGRGRMEWLPRLRTRPYVEAGWGLSWIEPVIHTPLGVLHGHRNDYFSFTLSAGVTTEIHRLVRVGVGGTYQHIATGEEEGPDASLLSFGISVIPHDTVRRAGK